LKWGREKVGMQLRDGMGALYEQDFGFNCYYHTHKIKNKLKFIHY
jgi:hypothetical protein